MLLESHDRSSLHAKFDQVDTISEHAIKKGDNGICGTFERENSELLAARDSETAHLNVASDKNCVDVWESLKNHLRECHLHPAMKERDSRHISIGSVNLMSPVQVHKVVFVSHEHVVQPTSVVVGWKLRQEGTSRCNLGRTRQRCQQNDQGNSESILNNEWA